MLGLASRTSFRGTAARAPLLLRSGRRHASFFTPPAHRRGTWKGFVARWGLAIGGIYWYNTSSLFAREPVENWQSILETAEDNHELPTVNSLTAARQARKPVLAAAGPSPPALDAPSPSTSPENSMAASRAVLDSESTSAPSPSPSTAPAAQGLEEEAEEQGAFNEETGEINWDCPCLGGMAHGPCGPQFREAFSCFVYSKEEPKGVDCIDRFKHMQDCFRAHPDIYGAELTDDPTEEEDGVQVAEVSDSGAATPVSASTPADLTASPSASPQNLSDSIPPAQEQQS